MKIMEEKHDNYIFADFLIPMLILELNRRILIRQLETETFC